ncbi:MAG TPA: tRNA (guanosine(46)-N7)-methyltransferase TrmB [Bauldia sp.]|nr:tRNA (guanosine(46)-N7)-methyltransferase TrmB [Bauldia sp.]
MAELLPRLALDVAAPVADLPALFPGHPSRINLEIGFGGGEHLVAEAARLPGEGFLGVEPFLNGMAKAVAAVADRAIDNLRLFGGEASVLLDRLPPESLDRVELLYPDPWPKKRHWKRRFVSPQNLDRIARVLKQGGVFRFASDIPSYVEWTLLHVGRDDRYVWTAMRAVDWLQPFAHWPGTRYEAKALAAGRAPTYLEFRRR